MSDLAGLRREAQRLSAEERAELVLDLLTSLESVEPAADVEQAWNGEAGKRLAAYDRGEISAEPAEDVHAAARARLR